ncbi:MAG: hypothetical protein U1F37_09790 [Alphaproteobacteria bacterium]
MTPSAKPPGLALLKTGVIVMGLLILLGLGAVVYGVFSKTQQALKGGETPDLAKAAVIKLGVPNAQVKSMSVSDRTLALHLAVPGQGEWVYVVPLSGDGRILKIAIGTGDTK